MEPTIIKKNYSLITENISLPTFFNLDLEAEMRKPVTPAILTSNLNSLLNVTDKAEQLYLDMIKQNIHQINNLINANKRGILSYFFYFEELKRMILIILNKFKMQQGQDGSAINHFRGQTSKEVIDGIHKDEDLTYIIVQQYRDQNPIKQLLASLLDLEQKILNSNHKMGMIFMNNITVYANYSINEIINYLHKLKDLVSYESKDKKQAISNELIVLQLILNLDNIKLLSICFHNGYFVDENNLCNIPEDHERWAKIKKVLVRVVSADEAAVLRDITEGGNKLIGFAGMFSQGSKAKNKFTNFFSNAYSLVNYKMNSEEALRDYKKSIIDENDKSFITLFNFMRIKHIKVLLTPTFPKCAYRKKLYLKRYEKEITLDYIKEIHEHLKKNPGTPMPLAQVDIVQPSSIMDKENALYLEKVEKNKKLNYISTRLLYVSNLALKNDDTTSIQGTIFNTLKSFKNPQMIPINSMIIFIHGGGFIGGNTLASEQFVRVWMNELNIPVIGIDYNLAPKHPYPKAVDDIWQAYLWVIKNAKEQLSIDPQHIILTGDSAGGNFCLSLTYMLIVHGIKLPDLLLLEYPGCSTDINGMTTSQLLVCQEKFLNYKCVSYCNQAYVGNYQDRNDFFLNVSKAPAEILKKLPKTRFYIASSDPLRDEAIHLIEKIAEVNADCKAYEFKEYTHGFFDSTLSGVRDNAMDIFFNDIRQHFESINVKLPSKELVIKQNKFRFLDY